ncbi:hypothetical protein JS561_12685 [Salmonella enterica subsp. enterica serovar Infantis]|nr:hypothetical protein JS561_12685 [Salmonella enterica subsp. enterica serovar Infantis]
MYLHAFLDGRDTPPRSAEASLKNSKTNSPRWAKAAWRLSSVVTTLWCDNRWDRVEKAYDLMTTAGANSVRIPLWLACRPLTLVMKTMSLSKRPLSAPRAG